MNTKALEATLSLLNTHSEHWKFQATKDSMVKLINDTSVQPSLPWHICEERRAMRAKNIALWETLTPSVRYAFLGTDLSKENLEELLKEKFTAHNKIQ